MKAKIVVGLGFGDEGKGITTDFLATKYPNAIVVRYCGGHQAGHTVIKGDVHHIFSSYCSGALRGAESYISEHCCFYPPFLQREEAILREKLVAPPILTIHPLAKLVTPYDIAYNRLRERRLNHGSVGVGIGTTMQRNNGPYKLHAVDIRNSSVLNAKLKQIKKYYESELYAYNAKELRYYSEIVEVEFKFFYHAIAVMNVQIQPYDYLRKFNHVIFEGAQGIMLDMDFGVFPNVTYGHTSSKNAIEICKSLGIRNIELYYVTRCYTTRHGNGWMPTGAPITLINNERETNVFNEWQGDFKVGELDYNLLNYALECDNTYSYDCDKHLVVTCLDQRPGFNVLFGPRGVSNKDLNSIIRSYSPDSKDFKQQFFYQLNQANV